MMKIIVPLTLLVFLSTLQFFIDSQSAPARVSVATTLLMTVITFVMLLTRELPRVGCKRGVDDCVRLF
jgi:hypothetical protein